MPGPSSSHRRIAPLAELQSGVVSREQALAHGISDPTITRLLRQQHWRRIRPGIYQTDGAAAGFAALAWAGVLAAGDAARIGGAAAAHLDGLAAAPDTILVLAPHGRTVAPGAYWHFVRERDGVRQPRSVGSPPRTTVEDTVLDLCEQARPEDVVGWLTTAVQRNRTTPQRLLRALDGRRRHSRRLLLQALLGEVEAGAESPIEVTYLTDVERAHGLPRGIRNRPSSSRGRTVFRDVRYPRYRTVVELDGRLGHEGMGRFRDMDRDNLAGLDGLFTLRYGSVDLWGRPCEVALQVAEALSQRGWAGQPSRCRRCARIPDQDWVRSSLMVRD